METRLFQVIDIEGENVGLFISLTKGAEDIETLCSEHRENALEAMEDIPLDEFLEQNGFERVFVTEVYDY